MRWILAAVVVLVAACSGRHITGTPDAMDGNEIVDVREVDVREVFDSPPDLLDPGEDDVQDVVDDDTFDATDPGEEDPPPPCDVTDPYAGCAVTGGTVVFPLCCPGASDFPESCTWDPCGCPEIESHNVAACDCGEGRCFDGMCCVDAP